MLIKKKVRRCKKKNCDNIIREYNKRGVCSNCQKDSFWKTKYDKLKKEFNLLKKKVGK